MGFSFDAASAMVRAVPNADPPWRLFIDTGGTFTDGLAVSPNGHRKKIKVLSGDQAPELAARQLTNTPEGQPLPPLQMQT